MILLSVCFFLVGFQFFLSSLQDLKEKAIARKIQSDDLNYCQNCGTAFVKSVGEEPVPHYNTTNGHVIDKFIKLFCTNCNRNTVGESFSVQDYIDEIKIEKYIFSGFFIALGLLVLLTAFALM